jgi:hypothetical protein
MNKADLVIQDFSDHDDFRFRQSSESIGIVLGFGCGKDLYDCIYKALESPEALYEVVTARIMWTNGEITDELAPCLAVISNVSL